MKVLLWMLLVFFSSMAAFASEGSEHAHDLKQMGAKKHHDSTTSSQSGAHAEGEHEEEGHEDEEISAGVGKGKAVEEASRKRGIRLSEKAARTIGIETEAIGATDTHTLSPQCIVYFQDRKGIYRLREGWFKLVEVEIVKKTAKTVAIRSDELKPGDNIVSAGVPLLRVSELEAFGGSGEGHGH